MLLKIGTKFEPHPALLPCLKTMSAIVYSVTGSEMVITSMKDRQHSDGSKHYVGLAFDIRSRNMEDHQIVEIINSFNAAKIGLAVRETTHIHIEANYEIGND